MAAGRRRPRRRSRHLPAAARARRALTRAAGPLNLTTFCQYVGLLGEVEDEVVEAFRNGGGVPYDRYPRFQRADGGVVRPARYERTLLAQVVPLSRRRGAAERRHRRGRRRLRQRPGAQRCWPSRSPTAASPASTCPRTAIAGAADASGAASPNVRFVVQDAAALGERELRPRHLLRRHPRPGPPRHGAGRHPRTLRPGGTYLCVEPMASSHVHENLEPPAGAVALHDLDMHCMTVSLAYGGEGLGAAGASSSPASGSGGPVSVRSRPSRCATTAPTPTTSPPRPAERRADQPR